MTTPLDSMELWKRTLANQNDGLDGPREILRQSFLSFRSRVADLVSSIGSELPNLTVHDITHIDALWRVAGEIAGPNYPLNPAEAYVLGGAFLLHDAAHVLAAYPGGLSEIKESLQWQDLIAQRRNGIDPQPGSAEEKSFIFQVLRHLHAEQAGNLPHISWKISGGESLNLIENYALRVYFGDLIGQIAASHHWSASKVSTEFSGRLVACPAFLAPASWAVDTLKVALLLRTADAAHLDSDRAPWFLFALRQPEGISADHWRFQAKIGQPTVTSTGELRFTSGSRFSSDERASWWLAFETAQMVDRELRSAHDILEEEGRPVFVARNVLGVDSAASFAKQLPVRDWDPVDVAPRIGNIPALIVNLGGAALYGENPAVPLRELLQNAMDAVTALRLLRGDSSNEGDVHVAVKSADEGHWWLSVTDTGIGMSRHVLTRVLLDFGSSLWSSDTMRDELPGLAKSGFRPVGKFGIGFFSIFMLGSEVTVTTRRYEQVQEGASLHWQLRFEDGLKSRPVLLQPSVAEALPRQGTRVQVRVSDQKLEAMLESIVRGSPFDSMLKKILGDLFADALPDPHRRDQLLALLAARICSASAVQITTQLAEGSKYLSVSPDDWRTVSDVELSSRVGSNCKELFPLNLANGRLIGRLALSKNSLESRPASIVYQGILCGELVGVEGLVCAKENNMDARRTKAFPEGSLEDWRRWAASVLEGVVNLDIDQKLRLNLLHPDRDLNVWLYNKNEVNLESIMVSISDYDEVILHAGRIEHEGQDEITSDQFLHRFEPGDGLICYPRLHPSSALWKISDDFRDINGDSSFPWFLGVHPIDYRARFEQALKQNWGDFELEEVDDYPVGLANGVEILRSPIKYVRIRTS